MAELNTITFEGMRGVNTKKSVTQRAPNDADLALNGYLDVTGAYIQRRGFLAINETEISSNFDINSCYQFGNEMIVAGSTNELIAYDLGGGGETSLSSSITGSFFDFQEFIPYSTEYLFLTNGKDNSLKYDGTTLTNLSIQPPSTLPTLAATTGGSLTSSATYLVSVTFLRDNGSGELQESNPCTTGSAPYTVTASVTLGGADNQIDLTNIPVSADTQVTGRNIYLSRPDGEILYKIGTGNDATIANNTATTYSITDNIDVLENAELEYDHDPAPKGYLIEKYGNRLIISGNEEFPDRVYVSQSNNVWYFPQGILDESNILYYSIGEKVTSIKSYYNALIVFGEKGGMFALTGGDTDDTFNQSQIKNDQKTTALSDRATLTVDNWCYFLSYDGYYRTNTQIIEKVSEPISAFFDPENQINSIYNVDGFSYGFNQIVPCAIYYKNFNLILLWITSRDQNSVVNDVCFVLHLSNILYDGDTILPNYSINTNFATRCTGDYLVNNFNKYFLTSQSDGFLFEAEKGKFDGAQVNSTVTSATANTLTDSTQAWTINAYAQIWVVIRSGTGAGQSNLILSNTADTLTLLNNWDITPDATSKYSVGGIYWQYTHSYTSYGSKSESKRLVYTRPRFISDGDSEITITFGYDFSEVVLDEVVLDITGSALWDDSLWDDALWDGSVIYDQLIDGAASRLHRWASMRIANYYAGQALEYDGHDKIFQIEGINNL